MTSAELEFRMGGIGCSDAPAVMKTSPWMTPKLLWELKTRRRFPDPPNFQMKQGLKYEPIARRAYEEQYQIEMPRDQVKHPKVDFVRAHMDGVNWELGRALEIKCPGRDDHTLAVKGLIPRKYLYQLVHILLASDLEEVDYFSYHRDRKTGKVNTATVEFRRDRKREQLLLSEETRFWEEYVLKDVCPGEEERKEGGIFSIRKHKTLRSKRVQRSATAAPSRLIAEVPNTEYGRLRPACPPADETRGISSIEEAIVLLQKAKALGAKVEINLKFDLSLKG